MTEGSKSETTSGSTSDTQCAPHKYLLWIINSFYQLTLGNSNNTANQ